MNIKATIGHNVNMNIDNMDTKSVGSKRKTDSQEGGKLPKNANNNKEDKMKEVLMEEGNETGTATDERGNRKKHKNFYITQDMAINITKERDGKQDHKNSEKMTLMGDKEEGKEEENEADKTNTIKWDIKPMKEVEELLRILAKNSLNEVLRKIGGWHTFLSMLNNEIT
eukprot:14033461-Ditylum_brightwellii.AAC.1